MWSFLIFKHWFQILIFDNNICSKQNKAGACGLPFVTTNLATFAPTAPSLLSSPPQEASESFVWWKSNSETPSSAEDCSDWSRMTAEHLALFHFSPRTEEAVWKPADECKPLLQVTDQSEPNPWSSSPSRVSAVGAEDAHQTRWPKMPTEALRLFRDS